MNKILILGGSSDIGKTFIDKIYKEDKFDIHFHYYNSHIKKNLYNRCNFIKVDLNKINEKNLSNIFDNNYDIIVNLIGYISNQSFLKFNSAELYKTININSIVPMLIIRNSLEHMIKKGYGRIINTSSVGIKFGGGSDSFSYSISKHINEFVPNHIRKLCSKNILYNTLRIGVTDTKFHKKIKDKSMKKRVDLIPIKKVATTNDISNYIYYLIQENNYIANEIINITGGE